jgi:hypothetical protein
MGAGRPTKYDGSKEWLDQIGKLCLLGFTDERLATFLDVNRDTIASWKIKYKEFSDTITENREVADANVSKSLYDQACDGNVRAQEIWLRNRQRDNWTETKKVELSGEITGFKIDLDNG